GRLDRRRLSHARGGGRGRCLARRADPCGPVGRARGVIVDAHHHFWDPATADYPWLTDDLAPIRRRFGPEDLVPLLLRRGIDATIVVQARSSLDETRDLLATAAEVSWLVGVVGWVDLTDPAIDDV